MEPRDFLPQPPWEGPPLPRKGVGSPNYHAVVSKLTLALENTVGPPGDLCYDITMDLTKARLYGYEHSGEERDVPYMEAVRRSIQSLCGFYKVPSPNVYFWGKDPVPSPLKVWLGKAYETFYYQSVFGLVRVSLTGGMSIQPEMLPGVVPSNGIIIMSLSSAVDTGDPWAYIEIPIHESGHHIAYRLYPELWSSVYKIDADLAFALAEDVARSFVNLFYEITGGDKRERRFFAPGRPANPAKMESFEEWWEENSPV